MYVSLIIISSISAMVWAGPRVTQVMAQDHRLWRWFSKKTKSNVPQRAISLQTTITLMLLFTGTFEQVIIYSSFVLQLFAALVVAGVFVVRHKNKIKSGFRRPLFPFHKYSFWHSVFGCFFN